MRESLEAQMKFSYEQELEKERKKKEIEMYKKSLDSQMMVKKR